MSDFYTISTTSQGEFKEKGSKFIAFAFPVSSEEQIKKRLEDLRKEYYDARHHCYAWIIGMEQQQYRSNDDGEPSHSAGDPILGQLRSFNLTNTLVVVIRYFGGTKLGVGGLISAYKTATELALSDVPKVQIFEMKALLFEFNYDQMSVVERLISDFNLEVAEREFLTSCKIRATIKKDNLSGFKSAISDLYDLKVSIKDD